MEAKEKQYFQELTIDRTESADVLEKPSPIKSNCDIHVGDKVIYKKEPGIKEPGIVSSVNEYGKLIMLDIKFKSDNISFQYPDAFDRGLLTRE